MLAIMTPSALRTRQRGAANLRRAQVYQIKFSLEYMKAPLGIGDVTLVLNIRDIRPVATVAMPIVTVTFSP